MVSEYTQNGGDEKGSRVLILVLVEDGLGAALTVKGASFTSLNPCFSGGWSRSISRHLLNPLL